MAMDVQGARWFWLDGVARGVRVEAQVAELRFDLGGHQLRRAVVVGLPLQRCAQLVDQHSPARPDRQLAGAGEGLRVGAAQFVAPSARNRGWDHVGLHRVEALPASAGDSGNAMRRQGP